MILKISTIAQKLSRHTPVIPLTALRSRVIKLAHRFIHNRRRLQSKTCLAVAAVIWVVFILTGYGVAALLPGVAAGQGLLRDNPMMARMSAQESGRYASTLADLLRDDPRMFLRLVESDVKLILHEPDLRRSEGPLAIWQYRSQTCVLDVYLSKEIVENNINETMRVVDYEARPRLKASQSPHNFHDPEMIAAADDATCFSSVLAAASSRPVILAGML